MEANKLTLNAKKTKAMLFCTTHFNKKVDELNLYMGNDLLENVNNCKYLGVILDQNLKWEAQINHTCKKCKQCFNILNPAIVIYNTRSSSQGNILLDFKPTTETVRRTFILRGAKAWNSLSPKQISPTNYIK